MNFAKTAGFCLLIIASAAFSAHADEVVYTLENVLLDDGGLPMTGTFTWTYDAGDFENGVGQFSFLDIPYTWHDHTDLIAAFDAGNSIEIILEGSVHDDGVDITLFLLQPLSTGTASQVDLVRSKYEIGGNGFHDGVFLSGEIVPGASTGVGDVSVVIAPKNSLTIHPNPFNPTTKIRYSVPAEAEVRLAIHNVAGRLVATLVDGRIDAGDHAVAWDGRSSSGEDVASGTYFLRLESSGELLTRKLTLVR